MMICGLPTIANHPFAMTFALHESPGLLFSPPPRQRYFFFQLYQVSWDLVGGFSFCFTVSLVPAQSSSKDAREEGASPIGFGFFPLSPYFSFDLVRV